MRLAWATDLHLDSVQQQDIDRFCSDVLASDVAGLLLGGDVGQARDLVHWLELLDSRLELPIYYVLGNHDYYGASVSTVRRWVGELESPTLLWLPSTGRVELSREVVLVGHGGWGDCQVGDTGSFEILTDYLAIEDLREAVDMRDVLSGFSTRAQLREVLASLGLAAAAVLRPPLLDAARAAGTVLVLTHVPPFREACWYRGRISEESWLPGFTCKAVGDLLTEVAMANPRCGFTVLCGHTHGTGYVRMQPNLEVYTAKAQYGRLFFRIVELRGREVAVRAA